MLDVSFEKGKDMDGAYKKKSLKFFEQGKTYVFTHYLLQRKFEMLRPRSVHKIRLTWTMSFCLGFLSGNGVWY